MSNRLSPSVKEAMRRKYISTDVDQRALAEEFGVTVQTVNRYSTMENWVELREDFKRDLELMTLEMTLQQQSELIVTRNDEHLKLWDIILQKAKLMAIQATKPQELAQIATVADKLQKGERLALGLDQMNGADDSQINDLIAALKASEDEGDA